MPSEHLCTNEIHTASSHSQVPGLTPSGRVTPSPDSGLREKISVVSVLLAVAELC